jgi:hypothetical protein
MAVRWHAAGEGVTLRAVRARSRIPAIVDVATVRGFAQLAVDATLGVARIVEGVHASVLRSTGLPLAGARGRTQGLTGFVYRGVRGTTRVVGTGVAAALKALERKIAVRDADGESEPSPAWRAALNGVLGDHLAASDNPLALPMTLRRSARVANESSDRVLLLVHGLCMTDGHWRTVRDGRVVDHGADTAAELGHVPIHVRYNTGLAIAANGRALSARLDALCAEWPVPLRRIDVLAHSMGGLVLRSACAHAEQTGARWRSVLRHVVFLGTPHGGAPLERIGHAVDRLLAATPWSAPFAAIGGVRSAGILDLRHGLAHHPLPEGVLCHAVAGTLASRSDSPGARLVGDGLVPTASALGRSRVATRALAFARESRLVVHGTGHFDLLASERVGARIRAWLAV